MSASVHVMAPPALAWSQGPAAPLVRAARQAAIVLGGALLLTVSAKIQVPFWPTPMTLQTLVVLLLALGCGWRLGLAAALTYLAQGAMGLPVFAGTPERGIGLAYMMGPTGGYLAGWVAAIVAMGWLAERGRLRGAIGLAAAGLLGAAIYMSLGWAWLASLIGPDRAWTLGVAPFLLGEAAKIGLAAALVTAARRLRRA